jgi:outer membrane lipoprotein SlyB
MKNTYMKIFAISALALALTACQTNPPRQNYQNYNNYGQNQGYTVNYNLGRVQNVAVVQVNEHTGTSGGGAVIGGLAGGVLGNQVGKGNGRKAMTVIGALAGGVAGNQIEASRNGVTVQYFDILVQLHNGQQVRVMEPAQGGPNFFIGQYVKVFQHPQTGQWRAIPD